MTHIWYANNRPSPAQYMSAPAPSAAPAADGQQPQQPPGHAAGQAVPVVTETGWHVDQSVFEPALPAAGWLPAAAAPGGVPPAQLAAHEGAPADARC
jgi:hypothetical protein